ncbi:molybdenum ABC transporter ATP-binding protein [Enterovirga sp.]|uniref:molybdenum ABC transporter ATP-binding protein n=1 Tax=Enterovirga sp. TaxID=2026350 RepID=UPI00261206BD|nr:molybdenum ABC transporter ATP-binding protein [Enterovirga sp.]MDB5591578.1 molybdate transporter, ATPase subunit [Enterovirga sp.]
MTGALSVAVEHAQGDFHLSASFSAPAGVTALFGRSGSGKTTLVNVIGGLLRPRSGRVVLGNATLLDTERGIFVPPHRRRIGYVFQEARLFPHLSVRQNLAFGRWFAPRHEGGLATEAVVALLGLAPLLGRRPGGLSGGERQRVAIGRALLAKPRLLLMDEPLASLDETRKAEILPFIERLRDEAGIPIVYVSHSVPEVARLADTLVVLEGGRLVAAGEAAEMLGRLDVAPLGLSRDAGAVLPGRIVGHDAGYGLTTVATPAGPLHLPRVALPEGATVRIQVLARDVMLSLRRPEGLSALNVLEARVAEIMPDGREGGAATDIRLRCGGAALVARITRKSRDGLGLQVGDAVFAVVKTVAFEAAPESHGPSEGEPAGLRPAWRA